MRFYKQCQLVKSTTSIRLDPAELKTIPIWDQFYRVALDIVGPFLETKLGNRYVLVLAYASRRCKQIFSRFEEGKTLKR